MFFCCFLCVHLFISQASPLKASALLSRQAETYSHCWFNALIHNTGWYVVALHASRRPSLWHIDARNLSCSPCCGHVHTHSQNNRPAIAMGQDKQAKENRVYSRDEMGENIDSIFYMVLQEKWLKMLPFINHSIQYFKLSEHLIIQKHTI